MIKTNGIFRAYDIRGEYGKTLTDEIVQRIPASFLKIVSTDRVVIGGDVRTSSATLMHILIRQFMRCGVDVVDIGMVSTDMFYYACGTYDLPGIMVTASHNPKEYNGFKMIQKLPHAICAGNGMEELEQGVLTNAGCEKKESANVSKRDILDDYIGKLFTIIGSDTIKPLTVVVDSAHGMTGGIWKRLGEVLPIRLIQLYFTPDGTFPHHEPDPLKPKNRVYTEEAVVKHNADIGFAFDADGDRCFVIDERGKSLPSEFCTALIAEYFLRTAKRRETVLYDVRSSWVIRDHIIQLGHTAISERVGHAYIKKTMATHDILFGGEVSGHYYFREFFYSDSGTLAALAMLALISSGRKTLSGMIEKWERDYYMSGEMNFTVKKTEELFQELNTVYKKGRIDHQDGFSVSFDQWHANIRISNTEPVVRMNMEAKTKSLLNRSKNDMIQIINKYT